MQVGFIGLGTMGASMASNLQKAGYKLVVHDLQRQNARRASRGRRAMGGDAQGRGRGVRGRLHVAARAGRGRERWRSARTGSPRA